MQGFVEHARRCQSGFALASAKTGRFPPPPPKYKATLAVAFVFCVAAGIEPMPIREEATYAGGNLTKNLATDFRDCQLLA